MMPFVLGAALAFIAGLMTGLVPLGLFVWLSRRSRKRENIEERAGTFDSTRYSHLLK